MMLGTVAVQHLEEIVLLNNVGLKAVFRYEIVGDVTCMVRELLDINVKLLIENVN
jgi:hypothetical protein